MTESDVIIVGGGPAGSSCAWALQRAGQQVLILDRKAFPRMKLCAGWITPRVWRMLGVSPEAYPHGLIHLKRLIFHFRGKRIPLTTRQYSIRRYEFDHWLLQRSGAPVIRHTVRHIREEGPYFVIDEQFRCRFLVGAGGTNCPVYHHFFESHFPRRETDRIATFEEEFPYPYSDSECYLWFFDNDLPGYSWYVPKGNGYLNVGIGAKIKALKQRGESLRDHWLALQDKLAALGLVEGHAFAHKGHQYFLRHPGMQPQRGRVYLVGDAAGLATVDMGEGIGPAIHSGLLAARSILTQRPYSLRSVPRYSFWDLLFRWRWKTR